MAVAAVCGSLLGAFHIHEAEAAQEQDACSVCQLTEQVQNVLPATQSEALPAIEPALHENQPHLIDFAPRIPPYLIST